MLAELGALSMPNFYFAGHPNSTFRAALIVSAMSRRIAAARTFAVARARGSPLTFGPDEQPALELTVDFDADACANWTTSDRDTIREWRKYFWWRHLPWRRAVGILRTLVVRARRQAVATKI